ncbi:DgyrCDS13500 [Dimorphilus gyrociliatus]|uniref:DgyrCDS13500 n=1 Tax=Dimorphilus gyrociliatus TaxID=2664684 RepID=A0A7I8WAX8_9ANNE|nr:DgyrCDS13500 [Dimorphilus gyrociliatus]
MPAEYTETILTCEGDYDDPQIQNRVHEVRRKLESLLLPTRHSSSAASRHRLHVKKVEPWNSVRVTLSVPREAARRLAQLAQTNGQVLRDLGVLSVNVHDGDRVLSLTLAPEPGGSENRVVEIRTQSSTSESQAQPAEGSLSQFCSVPSRTPPNSANSALLVNLLQTVAKTSEHQLPQCSSSKDHQLVSGAVGVSHAELRNTIAQGHAGIPPELRNAMSQCTSTQSNMNTMKEHHPTLSHGNSSVPLELRNATAKDHPLVQSHASSIPPDLRNTPPEQHMGLSPTGVPPELRNTITQLASNSSSKERHVTVPFSQAHHPEYCNRVRPDLTNMMKEHHHSGIPPDLRNATKEHPLAQVNANIPSEHRNATKEHQQSSISPEMRNAAKEHTLPQCTSGIRLQTPQEHQQHVPQNSMYTVHHHSNVPPPPPLHHPPMFSGRSVTVPQTTANNHHQQQPPTKRRKTLEESPTSMANVLPTPPYSASPKEAPSDSGAQSPGGTPSPKVNGPSKSSPSPVENGPSKIDAIACRLQRQQQPEVMTVGCVLASNQPSSKSGVIGQPKVKVNLKDVLRAQGPNHKSPTPDKLCVNISKLLQCNGANNH